MIIGIGGASGKLGSNTLAALRARGGDLRIVGLSRTPDRLPIGVEGRYVNYDEPESLAAAYAGLDRLLLVPTMDLRPGQRGKQNLAAIDAAVAARVGHIVFLSSAGTRAAAEPDVWASYYPAEQRLMATAPGWSVLRMNFYAEALVQEIQAALETGMLAGVGNGRVGFVSRSDLAKAAAGLLATDGHHGAIYTGTGPASLSGPNRAASAEAATGRPFEYCSLSADAFRDRLRQAGLGPTIVEVALSIQCRFAEGGFDIVTGDVERLSGEPPRTVDAVLAAAFAAIQE